MENTSQNHFYAFLNLVSQNQMYKLAIAQAQRTYNVKSSNISKLTPSKISQFYEKIHTKFYSNKQLKPNGWFQNQLRVFIWLLINYLYLHNKTIFSLIDSDWNFFSPIFNNKNILHFEFQSMSLNKLKTVQSRWEITEVDLLQKIIKSKVQKNKWNLVARDLFIYSNKKFYKTPKQCRQRWLNYLDPQKKKQSWDLHQDIILLETVLKSGKRWSMIVKYLKNARTQHNVKNRYKAIIAGQLKIMNQIQCIEQIKIIRQMISRLTMDLEENKSEKKLYQQLLQFQRLYPYSHEQQKNYSKNMNKQRQKTDVQDEMEAQQDQFLLMSEQSLEFQVDYHSRKQSFQKVSQNQSFDTFFKAQRQSTQQMLAQNYSEFEEQMRQFLN